MDFHIQIPIPPSITTKRTSRYSVRQMRTADLQVNKGNSAVKCSQNYDKTVKTVKTDSALRFGIVMIFVRCLPTGLQAIGNIGCKILGGKQGTLWSVVKWRMSF